MWKNLECKNLQWLMSKPLKIVISGGGTGGHIFPAIAIANEIKRRNENTEILFVGARDKMEMEKVPAAGFPIEGLWISGIRRSLSLQNLLFPFKLISSIFKSHSILKKFKPNIAIGTGGFASGPLLIAAQQRSIPTAIQEQNSFPGITNKKLGKRANKVFVAFDNMEQFFPEEKIVKSGNPIRKELFSNLPDREEAIKFFDLNSAKTTVLSVGGSLGSRTINNAWRHDFLKLQEAGLQLIWQTGKLEFSQLNNEIPQTDFIALREFIYKMNMAYAAADIIVSRAGAIAISELCFVGKPVILVPFPFAAENHQRKNAQALVDENAAIMILDKDAPNMMVNEVINVSRDKNRMKLLGDNIKVLGRPEATEHIVDEILKMI